MLRTLWKEISSFFFKGIEISYTRIHTYQTCSWKYKLMYVDGHHTPPNPFISLGVSIHRTLEDFHQRRVTTHDELLESYHQSWVNEGFASPQQAQDFYEKGKRMLDNYWETNLHSKSEIMYLEKDFKVTLGRNYLRGVIDRVDRHPDGTYEVIDYKTHAELWKKDRLDSNLQLSLYALACEKALGFKPGILSCYFLAHNCKLSTTRSPEQLQAARVLVEKTARKIIDNDFSPNPSHCYRCDFRKHCSRTKRN